MCKNRVSVNGWSPIGCEGFYANLNIPSPLPTTLVFHSCCRLLICICMHICMLSVTYMYMYAYMYVYVYVHMYMCMCICMCICICICICICLYVSTRVFSNSIKQSTSPTGSLSRAKCHLPFQVFPFPKGMKPPLPWLISNIPSCWVPPYLHR